MAGLPGKSAIFDPPPRIARRICQTQSSWPTRPREVMGTSHFCDEGGLVLWGNEGLGFRTILENISIYLAKLKSRRNDCETLRFHHHFNLLIIGERKVGSIWNFEDLLVERWKISPQNFRSDFLFAFNKQIKMTVKAKGLSRFALTLALMLLALEHAKFYE